MSFLILFSLISSRSQIICVYICDLYLVWLVSDCEELHQDAGGGAFLCGSAAAETGGRQRSTAEAEGQGQGQHLYVYPISACLSTTNSHDH